MRKLTASCLITILMSSACNRTPPVIPEIVEETYQHKYGMEVSADDWKQRGSHGQVMITLKNGVKICKSYVAGELHGDSLHSFPHSDTIQKRETYDNGLLIKEQMYYPSGAPKERSAFKEDGAVEKVTWLENGLPQSAEIHSDGLLVQGEYYNQANKIESTVKDLQGTRVNRDQYGHLISTDELQSGKMISRTTYHPNGNIKQIITFKDDLIDGDLKLFHPEGEPEMIQQWQAGQHTGTTTVFENGEKVAEVNYVDGKKHGIEKHFKDGSSVVEEITWEDDLRHGPTVLYVGNKPTIEWYYNGKPVSKIAFDRMTPRR